MRNDHTKSGFVGGGGDEPRSLVEFDHLFLPYKIETFYRKGQHNSLVFARRADFCSMLLILARCKLLLPTSSSFFQSFYLSVAINWRGCVRKQVSGVLIFALFQGLGFLRLALPPAVGITTLFRASVFRTSRSLLGVGFHRDTHTVQLQCHNT